jgi:protein SCO1/2
MNTFKRFKRWRSAQSFDTRFALLRTAGSPSKPEGLYRGALRSSRNPIPLWHRTKLLVLLAAFVFTTPVFAHEEKPGSGALEGVALVERLGAQLPLNTTLRDEIGASVRLGQYFTGKSVLRAFVYYNCPQLCPLILEGLGRSLRTLPFKERDYQVVAISIDPTETPALAAEKKRSSKAGANWHYLTGTPEAIAALTEAAGFGYRATEQPNEKGKREFIHPANTVIATPDGKISRYFSSIDFPPTDLRYSLIEASGNRIGSPLDHLLLLCYRYDAAQGRYTLAVLNTLRGVAIFTVATLIAFIGFMLMRERKNNLRRFQPFNR